VQWSVESGGNGHWYEVVFGDTVTYYSWTQAFAAANAAICNSCGPTSVSGYLVTITSAAENAFVSNTVATYTFDDVTYLESYWMAGSDAGNEGVWTWRDGPEAGQSFWFGGQPGEGGTTAGTDTGYASWALGDPSIFDEPNHSNPDENYAIGNWNGGWNDWCNGLQHDEPCFASFVIEYSAAAEASAAPEPASLAVLGAGLVAAGAARRRRR
jgi:hypothetical protein